jgi:hypothetical protein
LAALRAGDIAPASSTWSPPHVGRSLLEVGSGLGHFSEQFSGRLEYLIVSDNDPYCIGQLKSTIPVATMSRSSSLRYPAKSRHAARLTRW